MSAVCLDCFETLKHQFSEVRIKSSGTVLKGVSGNLQKPLMNPRFYLMGRFFSRLMINHFAPMVRIVQI
jgi:hypothetical protein